MLYYALVFLLVALLSAGLGFSGIAGNAQEIAKILVTLFLILAFASVIMSLVTRRKPPLPPAV